ncbi:hypothetical protein [Burkholderia phage FLC9]|nr:hypothetical protein [Burkholderia phage FLC9]
MIQLVLGYIRTHLTYDMINACLELAGATLRSIDCIKLYRAKRFQGGSLWTALFFFLWGLFNIVYYPSFNQTYSWAAAIALTVVNGLWISMAVFYNRRYSKQQVKA